MTRCMTCKWCREESKPVAEQLGGICIYPDESLHGCFVPFDSSCKYYEASTVKDAFMRRSDALETLLQLKNEGKISADACFSVCSALYEVSTTEVRPLVSAKWGYKEWGMRYCTNCGFEPAFTHDKDLDWDMQCTSCYCPHCGAVMCKEDDYNET